MRELREQWKTFIYRVICEVAFEFGADGKAIEEDAVQLGRPPKPELGDIAVPCFSFAKVFRSSPVQIAQKVCQVAEDREDKPSGTITTSGPYVNITIDTGTLACLLEQKIACNPASYGLGKALCDQKVMIEFSCPNTNKPLHLGHLRNDALGMSVSRILKANGAEVRRVNLINDRGVHICKSMLAYREFSQGATPESTGRKSDHFVGDYYVRFASWAKSEPEAEKRAQGMLSLWEQGDPQVLELWKLMNRWTIEGIKQTYEKTGIEFDDVYYESKTYQKGRAEVLAGLERGVFYKEDDGSVWVDLEPIGLDKKVLLRSDGTSLYLTQDIGTAIDRHRDWPFDSLVYVVASEQQYHFRVLFYVLSLLGYEWAEHLYHLSYGMVNLPDGKMKSREGTVVDADDLFDELSSMARKEIISKGREEEVGDVQATSDSIALGALNYYLLQVSPSKDMIFDPSESISFNGNTGPYLQYMGARISSMLKKYEMLDQEVKSIPFDANLLSESVERELIKLLAEYPQIVESAGREYNPSMITAYLFELSKLYSRFYHDHPILRSPSGALIKARVTLSRMALAVLKNAFELVGIPFLESM